MTTSQGSGAGVSYYEVTIQPEKPYWVKGVASNQFNQELFQKKTEH